MNDDVVTSKLVPSSLFLTRVSLCSVALGINYKFSNFTSYYATHTQFWSSSVHVAGGMT